MNRTATRSLIFAVVATVTTVLAGVAATDANAAPTASTSWVQPGQVEPPVTDVDTLTVAYAERVKGTRLLWAEFNDGRVMVLRPCRFEDGRRCWWDAGTSGNGIGTAFVSFAGQVSYIDLSAPYGLAAH